MNPPRDGATGRDRAGRMRGPARRTCQKGRRCACRATTITARRSTKADETTITETMSTQPPKSDAPELIAQFLRSLEVRGMSPATRRSYASDLAQLREWSDARGLAFAGFNRGGVRAFAADLGRRGYAPATLARKLSTVRSFCRFLTERGVLAADPAQYLPGPRRRRRLPHSLRPAEIDAICDAVRGSDAFALRDRLVFELLYGCGLRTQELVDLGCDDLHARRGELLVRGKGGKMRMVPLGDEAAAALERYLASAVAPSGGGAAQPPRPRAPCCSPATGGRCTPPTCAASSPSTPPSPALRPRRTCSATPMRRTCSSTAPICGPSRSFSVTARYRPRSLHPRERRPPQGRAPAPPPAVVSERGRGDRQAWQRRPASVAEAPGERGRGARQAWLGRPASVVRGDDAKCGHTESGGTMKGLSPWATMRAVVTW